MPDTITIDEMKALIKEEKISPSRLFGSETLSEDPVVKGIVQEAVSHAKTIEYTHRKRLGDRFYSSDEEQEKENKKKDEKIKELEIKGAKRDATDLFSSKAKERKLSEKQMKFVAEKQGNFEPKDLEKLDKEVDVFMDETLEEYKKTAEIFGHKVEKGTETEEKKTAGGEPGEEEEGEEADHIPD